MKALRVTISTVAVGRPRPAESRNLANIAQATGGKFYAVNNPNALPRIYQREARRVARPLVYESEHGIRLQIRSQHEIISGIDDPAADHRLRAHHPQGKPAGGNRAGLSPAGGPGEQHDPGRLALRAGQGGGLHQRRRRPLDQATGRTSRPTTSFSARWSAGQCGRPAAADKFTMATEVVDGQVRVVVNALDKNDEFRQFPRHDGHGRRPRSEAAADRRWCRPRRAATSARCRSATPAAISSSSGPGAGMAPIRTGVNVPYSDEFRDRATNDALLGQLAALAPKGGAPGRMIEAAGDGRPR